MRHFHTLNDDVLPFICEAVTIVFKIIIINFADEDILFPIASCDSTVG